MLAFILEPYSGSIRKRATQKPKFYFCDIGISRALGNLLSVPLLLSTNAYGNVFEHFIIAECIRLNDYLRKDFKFSYLRTSNNAEIDLIIERPGSATLLIEIKSSKQVNAHMLKHLLSLSNNFSNAKMICLLNDPYAKKFDNVLALYY